MLFVAAALWVSWIRGGSQKGSMQYGFAVVFTVLFVVGGVLFPVKEEVISQTDKFIQIEWDGKKYEGMNPTRLNEVEEFHKTAVKWEHKSLFGISLGKEIYTYN